MGTGSEEDGSFGRATRRDPAAVQEAEVGLFRCSVVTSGREKLLHPSDEAR